MDGTVKLTDPRHQRVLEWEMTPRVNREPATANALAEELGVSARTIRGWKDSPKFQAAWKELFTETAGSLERTKSILDSLFHDATDGDHDKRVQAAKLYFDISKQIAPPEPEVGPSRHAQDLTDDELRELMAVAASEELEARAV